MFDTTELFDLKQEHFTGKIINIPPHIKKITKVTGPEAKNILIIKAQDLKTNSINIDNLEIPVFAEQEAIYRNQQFFAVFGSTADILDSYCSSIKIEGLPFEEKDEVKEEVLSKTYRYTSPFYEEEKPDGPLKSIQTAFKVNRFSKTLFHQQRIYAVYKDEILHLKLSTQWQFHLKKSVSRALGLQADQIVLHNEKLHEEQDQFLFEPTFGAIIAGAAAIKSSVLTELDISLSSIHPALSFTVETLLNKDGLPVEQKTDIFADLGHFPYYSEEYARSLICGCTPVYKLNKFEINIKILKSADKPSVFFGGLGYSDALCATEKHFSAIAEFLNLSPSDLKMQLCGAEYPEIRSSDTKKMLQQTTENAVESSGFTRKFFTYSQENISKTGVSTLLGYKRGIGIACGEGIQGFSNEDKNIPHFTTIVSYTQDGRLILDSSLTAKHKIQDIIEESATKVLKIRREQVVFKDFNDSKADIGPYTLARSICFLPQSVERACEKILKALKSKKEPPFTILSKSDTPKGGLFNSHTCGCAVVEVFIDPILGIPKISDIIINIQAGKIINKSRFENDIRKTVSSILQTYFPCIQGNYSYQINFNSDPSMETGSVSSLVKGLLKAACSDAISQALNKKVEYLPLTTEDVMINIPQKQEAAQDS